MGLSDDQKLANDMTKSGRYCPNDKEELEKVSGEIRYTCHWCGAVYEIDDKGEIVLTHFEGFK